MAQKKSTVIRYSKPGTQPPIYLAGSFSNPEWTPLPMQYTESDGEYAFTKEVEVEEGKDYQYKFRVGEGDWWLLNEDEPTVTDHAGNRNNLFAVPIHAEEKTSEAEEIKDLEETSSPKMDGIMPDTPIVMIEKVDSAPRHGDDFGEDATAGQKDAHKSRAQDAEPDYVVVRSQTHTPEFASNAAEVADSAMLLDREVPTPPMLDEEAGRTGYRRMSYTPIPQVAETAAEVAGVAATLDKENTPILEMASVSTTFDIDQSDAIDSGASTPSEDRAPLFVHECLKPPPGGFESPQPIQQPRPEPFKSKLSIQEDVIDYNDPLLEEFPSERNAILQRIRTSGTHLPEDQTSFDGIPPSPVAGPKYAENMERSLPSANLASFSQERSPSLNSIAEDGEESYGEDLLATLPGGGTLNLNNGEPHLSQGSCEDEDAADQKMERKPSVDVQEVPESPPLLEPDVVETAHSGNPNLEGSYIEPAPTKLPNSPLIFENSKQLGSEEEEAVKAIVSPEEGPQITVQPATPGSSSRTTTADPFNKPVDTAKATAIEEENGRSQLTSRKPVAASPERPLTPTSMRSAGKDAKSRNFLKAFWRVVFVEWIGGFIWRLCGGDRHKALLAISALILIALAPAVYFAV